MIRVQVRQNETLEAALRRFKRQCNYAGVFRLAKKYSSHEKRSDKRRRENRERIRNIRRALLKSQNKTRVQALKRAKGRSPRPTAGASEAAAEITASGATRTQVAGSAAAATASATPGEGPAPAPPRQLGGSSPEGEASGARQTTAHQPTGAEAGQG